jgi:8-oxo-dGTP pyrophosphatase MutT (NUDIX family)
VDSGELIMGASEYVKKLRTHIGNDLLLIPGVTAVIFDDEGRVLLGCQLPSLRWSFIGGAIEPEESPQDALHREVSEELGAEIEILDLVGSYGGPLHTAHYDNGDIVSYVVTVYLARLTTPIAGLEDDELAAAEWFVPADIPNLKRPDWLDTVLADATRSADAALAQAGEQD